jgi:hypothetical protein
MSRAAANYFRHQLIRAIPPYPIEDLTEWEMLKPGVDI